MKRLNRKNAGDAAIYVAQQEAFLEALVKCDLNITKASALIGIGRGRVADWRKNDPEFRQRYEDLVAEELDKDEGRLKKLIEQLDDENADPKSRNVSANALFFKLKSRHPDYKPTREAPAEQAAKLPNQVAIFIGTERVQLQDMAKQIMGMLGSGKPKGKAEESE